MPAKLHVVQADIGVARPLQPLGGVFSSWRPSTSKPISRPGSPMRRRNSRRVPAVAERAVGDDLAGLGVEAGHHLVEQHGHVGAGGRPALGAELALQVRVLLGLRSLYFWSNRRGCVPPYRGRRRWLSDCCCGSFGHWHTYPKATSRTIITVNPSITPVVARSSWPCRCDSGMTSSTTTKIIAPAAKHRA